MGVAGDETADGAAHRSVVDGSERQEFGGGGVRTAALVSGVDAAHAEPLDAARTVEFHLDLSDRSDRQVGSGLELGAGGAEIPDLDGRLDQEHCDHRQRAVHEGG